MPLWVGFKFPDVSPADIDCITAVEESIQGSKEATEQAEKERMAAKLDFLLLRGSTADLNAANELMKVLVGYVPAPIIIITMRLCRRTRRTESAWTSCSGS